MDFSQWLETRNIDCEALVPELLEALQSQFEAECQQRKPVTEAIVLSDDWPRRVHRVTQKTFFDCTPEYQ